MGWILADHWSSCKCEVEGNYYYYRRVGKEGNSEPQCKSTYWYNGYVKLPLNSYAIGLGYNFVQHSYKENAVF